MQENLNFIEKIIKDDHDSGVSIKTRFPPEPNGFLHLGHVKSIVLNFSMAEKYGGTCNLRFDDTNPEKESDVYINSIQQDVKWLGFDVRKPLFASDYYDVMLESAVKMIKEGKAYVDSATADDIKSMRGTLTEGGQESEARNKSVEENLREFEDMKNGKYPEGSRVLRAKIDMSSSNINLRDPILYRIRYKSHPRTGDKWCIYPMYDFAHSIEDGMEGITHSLCTLEFEDHRPMYDWVCDNDTVVHKPRQIEFARLNVNYLVMSKRKLLYLVENGYVDGWDDPRLPTVAGLRRRGYTPSALREFAQKVGITKVESIIDYSLLEFTLREELNRTAQRLFAVTDPILVEIDNYPEGRSEVLMVENNPEKPSAGKRKVVFSKRLFIEREDFSEDPPKGYFRLSIGQEVRLKGAYYIKATSIERNPDGSIAKVHAVYDPESKGGETPDGRKVKGTIHYLCADNATAAEFRLYDKLFNAQDPGSRTGNYLDDINPDSLQIRRGYVERCAVSFPSDTNFQFVRNGYFIRDRKTPRGKDGALVFNRTATLKDTWAKISGKNDKSK